MELIKIIHKSIGANKKSYEAHEQIRQKGSIISHQQL